MVRAWLGLLLACLQIASGSEPPPWEPPSSDDSKQPPPICDRSPKAGDLFSTDNFPQKYASNTFCTYRLEASPDKRVKLTVFVIEMETNDQCRYDYLTVRDTGGEQLHKLCGQNSKNVEVISSGENLTLTFGSDSVQENAGFLASWEEIEEEGDVVFPVKQETAPEYLVSYPSALLLASPEKLCVELFQAGPEAKVTVDVFAVGSEDGGEPWLFETTPLLTETTSIAAGSAEGCLELTLPTGTRGDSALLNIKLVLGESTVNSYKKVSLLKDENYPLVQTDKGQYKAKDTVKFRVMILDNNLRPSPISSVEELWIEDPRGRRIKQWNKQPLDQGILQQEMKLGKEPELGVWTVNFKAGDLKEKTTFKVDEYVLPTFEVEIVAPPAVLKDAEVVEWKVCAKYTHGGAVKGMVRSNFSSRYQGYNWRNPPPPVLREVSEETEVTADMDCAVLLLNQEQIKNLTEKVENFKLEVEFEEASTGTKVTKETTSYLKDKALILEIGSSSREYILGGFPYTGEFVVKGHNNQPRVDEDIEVCVRLYKDIQKIRDDFNKRGIWSMAEDEMIEMGRRMLDISHAEKCHKTKSDASGKVKFHVPLGSLPEDVKKLSIKAKAVNFPSDDATGMKQPEQKLDVILSHKSSDLTLGLSRKERTDLQCDQDFTATVFFSSPTDRTVTLHYQALSKGVIASSGRVEVKVGETDARSQLVEGTTEMEVVEIDSTTAPKVSSVDVVLPIDYRVSPSLKLVVFVNEGDATLGDTHTYSVEACQNHHVTAQWSKQKVYPGEDVTLSVGAQAGSLCALSATDKSVDLLGNPNKITGDRVARLQEQIGRRKTGSSSSSWQLQRKCPDAYKALQIYEGTGIRILTNLPFLANCETVSDAGKGSSNSGGEVLDSPVPVAFSAESAGRAKRLARLRRHICEPALQDSPVVAFSAFESSAAAPPSRNKISLQSASKPEAPLAEPQVSLRDYFPETWLFELGPVKGSAGLRRNLTAPHTITTWSGEAICISNEVGLGVARPVSLLVSQDFFAELRLPYSVKRGETFPLNVTVFNYVDVALPMTVTVKNQAGDLEMSQTSHSICLKAKDNDVISIPTTALKLGELNVTVEARISNSVADSTGCTPVGQGEGFMDALVKPLRVKPEGVPVEKVQSEFKCFETGNEKFSMNKLEVPDNAVEDSERAWVSLTGDIMAPALENVGNLVRLPTGCGEQNMVGLVPNIYLLQYLEGTNQKEDELEEKAKEYMRIGYRRQAKYNHPNGAYSIWGDKGDKDGSSWLTAFVVKSFSEAAKYISVDAGVVQRSVDWLMGGQMENGCFPKRGYTHSSYLKGGGSDSTLTPFIVTSLLEAASSPALKIRVDYKKLGEAVQCMMKAVNTSDLYSTIVTANTMSLMASKLKGDSPLPENIMEPKSMKLLDTLMTFLDTEANSTTTDSKFWSSKTKEVPRAWRWWHRASSEEVEMTAYMIQSLVLREQEGDALESVKWLGRQRNSRGGFVSTQDTVVALQALSMYSQRVTRIPLDMTVSINEKSNQENKVGVFNMNSTNGLLLQNQDLALLPADLEVETKGSGCAMFQTVLRYNVPEATENKGFDLKASQEGEDLVVCAMYTGSSETTGMVVMEVEMVSGWEAVYPESLLNDVSYEIQRVEKGKEDEDTVVLYFDSWPKSPERCINIQLKQVTKITEAKPAVVTIYDYYKTSDKASELYSLK